MRKILSLLVVFAMVSMLFAGCGAPAAGNKGGTSAQVTVSNSEEPSTAASAETSASAKGALNASDSYNAYMKVKGSSYGLIKAKIGENEDLSMVSMILMPVVSVDISLIPLTIVSYPDGISALSKLNMSDMKISGANNDYTITYTVTDSQTNAKSVVTQTCKYDPATDSMQSRISDETGKEAMFFEYTKTPAGYVSQYYYDNGDGTFGQIKSYFDGTDTAAFGMQTVSAEPESIMGKSSLNQDFVKGGESYFILQSGALTVLDNGTTNTY